MFSCFSIGKYNKRMYILYYNTGRIFGGFSIPVTKPRGFVLSHSVTIPTWPRKSIALGPDFQFCPRTKFQEVCLANLSRNSELWPELWPRRKRSVIGWSSTFGHLRQFRVFPKEPWVCVDVWYGSTVSGKVSVSFVA